MAVPAVRSVVIAICTIALFVAILVVTVTVTVGVIVRVRVAFRSLDCLARRRGGHGEGV